ncbi:hypothetical protein [Empedobacter tilapiae]|uniref:Uncharacterized protein n=1 Tax=Empedobacter tilapiae TaxID=2491114 RepID=A0A4Z1C240_9FLAO|nr:hypothetical protein [Empedobacter tilapiae]TGN26461.1 hypothetical protein E4J94_11585 [Empedobacter tilapiae]
MIETSITLLINRKTDFDLIKNIIINSRIDVPIYMVEYEFHIQINFTSDNEQWELETEIVKALPDYEFSFGPDKGRKEARIQLSRYQSSLCTDGWGRRIEDPLDETKYLVKKSKTKSERFNPKMKILFDNVEQTYYINIVEGINEKTNEEGYILLNEFKNHITKGDILIHKLYKSRHDAFLIGQQQMQKTVNVDYENFKAEKKKKIRAEQRIPRKIVRNFINSCNKSDCIAIFNNLSENIYYEKRKKWKTEYYIESLTNFKEYILSSEQDICSKNFIIRSSWEINLPFIKIGVKFFPHPNDNNLNSLEYRDFTFKVENEKITQIIEEKFL